MCNSNENQDSQQSRKPIFCDIHDCIICQFLGLQRENVRWQVFENMLLFSLESNDG